MSDKHYVNEGVHSLNGDTIQVLPPQSSPAPQSITTSGTSAQAALPAGSVIVRLAATEDMYIKFGNTGLSAAATDILFLAGTEVMAVPRDSNGNLYDYIAAIQVSTAGVLNIVRMGK